jgi:hypothetical protein
LLRRRRSPDSLSLDESESDDDGECRREDRFESCGRRDDDDFLPDDRWWREDDLRFDELRRRSS